MKRIRLSERAQEQALERGATEAEVKEAVRKVHAKPPYGDVRFAVTILLLTAGGRRWNKKKLDFLFYHHKTQENVIVLFCSAPQLWGGRKRGSGAWCECGRVGAFIDIISCNFFFCQRLRLPISRVEALTCPLCRLH